MRRTFQTNFTSGEIDPQFLARMDLTQYQNGAEKMRNMFPLPQGGAKRRPGLEFIEDVGLVAGLSNPSVDTPILVEFEFGLDQTYLFILSDKRIDIYRDDTHVSSLTSDVPWGITELKELAWVQNLDTIIFFHKDHPMTRVMRQGSDILWDIEPWGVVNTPRMTFSNTDIGGVDAVIELNITGTAAGNRFTLFVGGVETAPISIGASTAATAANIEAAIVAMDSMLGASTELVLNGEFISDTKWTKGANWSIDIDIDKDDPGSIEGDALHGDAAGPDTLSQPLSIVNGSTYVLSWRIPSTSAGASITPKIGGTSGTSQSAIGTYTEEIVAGANGLIEFDAVNRIRLDNVSLKLKPSIAVTDLGGTKHSVAFTNDVGERPWSILGGNVTFDNASIVISVLSTTVGEIPNEPAWGDQRGYPRCGTFFQNRLWVAGSRSAPQSIWASRIDDFSDFSAENSGDTWGIAVTLDTKDVSAIYQIHPGRNLQLFTSSKEFYSILSEDTVLTPSNISFRENSERGIKAGIPVVGIDGATIFVQQDGKAVRSFVFSDSEQAYQTESISLFSSHLLVNPVDISFRKAISTEEADRFNVVNSDGTLAVLSFVRNQDVNAWALESTAGEFLSSAVLNKDTGREEYFLIRRVIDGTPAIFLEKFNSKLEVDAGIVKEDIGAVVPGSDSISWLDNAIIDIVVDGVVEPQQQLPSVGPTSVIFSTPAEDSWQLGLPFPDVKGDGSHTWLKTMPFVAETETGISVGKRVRISEATIRMIDTAALAVQGRELSFREFGDELLDQPIKEFTGDKTLKALRGWTKLGQLDITQSHPLPATVLGIGMKVSV